MVTPFCFFALSDAGGRQGSVLLTHHLPVACEVVGQLQSTEVSFPLTTNSLFEPHLRCCYWPRGQGPKQVLPLQFPPSLLGSAEGEARKRCEQLSRDEAG